MKRRNVAESIKTYSIELKDISKSGQHKKKKEIEGNENNLNIYLS